MAFTFVLRSPKIKDAINKSRQMKPSGIILASGLLLFSCSTNPARNLYQCETDANKASIANAFERWRNGTGNFFDLLPEDTKWLVAGSSKLAGLYKSKQSFLNSAVAPVSNKLAGRIQPELISITADGPTVWLHWKGTAVTKTGKIYRNEYAWKMELENGKIIRTTAFLDSKQLDELLEHKYPNMKTKIEETKEYLGMWVTADGRIRHELLPGNRYDEARGNRKSAYQGSYKVTGNHIDYTDDTGFTADGEFRNGVLFHGGMIFYKEIE